RHSPPSLKDRENISFSCVAWMAMVEMSLRGIFALLKDLFRSTVFHTLKYPVGFVASQKGTPPMVASSLSGVPELPSLKKMVSLSIFSQSAMGGGSGAAGGRSEATLQRSA